MRKVTTAMSTNPYQIWLEADGEKLLLPVNPEKIDIKVNGNNQSVTVVELGEIVVPQAPKATVLSFSSFFPAVSFTGCQYAVNDTISTVGDFNGDGKTDVRDLAAKARAQKNLGGGAITVSSDNTMKVTPHYCISFILSAMKAKIPVRVCITKCDFIRHMTIESFNYTPGEGDVGDYNYSISFKDYRSVNIKAININKAGKGVVSNTPKRVDNTVRPKTYTVKSGDTIYALAKKYYGDVIQYRKIYDANKKLIGSNPNRIKPGMTLTLP